MKTKTRAIPSELPKIGQHQETEMNHFPIVGIGASAGGLEALEQFFQHLPDNTGLAYVVIQHLDPTHTGIMPELLQRLTNMKVLQVTDSLKVKPNNVYVIPPNKSMSLLNGLFHLFDPTESRGLRLPIDIFFRSLALDRLEKSVGIVLSGMGSDGSLGLQAIKEKNGMVLVQDPVNAKFDSMPRNAIDSVIADIIAPANELAGKLISFLQLNPVIRPKQGMESKDKSNIDKIILLIRDHTGHDFSSYKKTTLLRRIERRKSVHEIEKIPTYIRYLLENPLEIEILFKELLIGVTSFFRDPAVWDTLKDKILPELLKNLPNGSVLRAWVPGCSTGEEAYSLAIIFRETMEYVQKQKNISLQIFATDIDSDAIDKARKGYFTSNISTDVSPERINRFFTVEGEGYHINSYIREMVVFAPHSIIKDPPFTKLDILSCRNMLIYLEPELQKKILSLFNYSLNPGGLLILGSAETTGTQNDGFRDLDPKKKIYMRSSSQNGNDIADFPSSFRQQRTLFLKKNESAKIGDNLQLIADQLLLQRYAPASVVVNNKGDILYITGKTGKYLEPVAGKANWNIYSMAREGLGHELPGAFRKALNDFEPVILNNLKILTNNGPFLVNVSIQRLEYPEFVRGMFIVVFTDVPPNLYPEVKDSKKERKSSNARVKDLENELQRSLEENQGIREEMQTSQEELKSTNEELQSTNEELQSTNEELTTSKEEMQSLNEELQTVNIELQSKVIDLLKANDDMKNLLNSTEVATLFLDRGLNIRRFTDPVTQIFKLRNTDIGRPFTDLVSNLLYPNIDSHALQVVRTLTPIESANTTTDGRWFNIRIMPYRTTDDRIDGLVITFNDITDLKNLEIELKAANEALKKEKL
jgi:two-component system CheB/CheR fusion protein